MNKIKISKRLLSSARMVLVAVMVLPLVSVTEIVLVGSQQAYAQKTTRVQSIRQKHIKNFEKIQAAFDAENSSEVLRLIGKIEQDPELNNIERAYIRNFRGSIYFTQDNLSAAAREFKGIVNNSEGVPESFVNQMYYVLAQVSFSQGSYREALTNAKRYISTLPEPSADMFMLVGQAHFQLKEYDQALVNVQKGIDRYKQQGKQPKEGWLNLLASIYRNKSQYTKMVPVLKQLINFYPKKSYLSSLAGVYNELNEQESMTGIFQAMYDAGMLTTESEIVTIASLQMNLENPYKAATILEKGINSGTVPKSEKNYSLYSQALFLAREYEEALDPLSKAASQSSNGKKFDQLGQSYVALNRWSEAESALSKAVARGGLQNTGQTLMSLGLAQFEQKKYQPALSTFKRAAGNQKTRSSANNWIKYINNELARIDALNEEVVIDTDVKAEER